jgi:hypothetical protein
VKRGRTVLGRYVQLPKFLGAILLAVIFSLLTPQAAYTAGSNITISGPGLENPDPVTITQDQLQGKEPLILPDGTTVQQHDEWYSTINTWPTKSWYRGKGIKLMDLLNVAGGLKPEATQISFISSDGFKATFTVQELINEPRYRFPNFMDTGLPGHLPGDPSEAVPVEPMIAHQSICAHDMADIEDIDNFSRMDANLLLYGQRSVTQQTNARFAKYVTAIEVLTDPVAKWDNPTADPVPGEVAAGTMVQLKSPFNDEDKVHYTLDGSNPTIHSPMYNWIASRWWASRPDELEEINHPIEINENTTIKAFVTGPGRADSDIVTFEYRVPFAMNLDNPTRAIEDQEYPGYSFTATGGLKPYSFVISEGTLPEGMSLNGASLEGTPVEKGIFTFTITVTDSAEPANTASHQFTLVVDEAGSVPLDINKDNPVKAVKNEVYPGYTFQAMGGIKPYSFTLSDGTLPEGMSLNGANLEGIPMESGTFTFTITVTDSTEPAKTVSHEFTLVVDNSPPVLVPDTTDNHTGMPIELTFIDDQAWREAITDVKINQTSITGRYSVAAGVITINAGVFRAAGNYTIEIVADGYINATVIQVITGSEIPPEEEIVLTIRGDGVTGIKEYTQSQLEAMDQYQYVYSCINTWPTKKWYVGKGVLLNELLDSAGMKGNARQVKFIASDGYYMTLTVDELLYDKRYRFPNFKSGGSDADGHIPGSSSGAQEVGTILALVSAEGTDNPSYMNDMNALLLMLGQRAVTEQTGPLFVKNINEIEVLTYAPGKWDEPTAEPAGGLVKAGTKVVLHGPGDDIDKVYYTTDGSLPDLNSPMYNWIARRWWAARGAKTVAEVNRPVEINEDTIIKAVTIGPGKMDSDIVEFIYTVIKEEISTKEQIKPSEGGTVKLGDEAILEIPAGALDGTNPVEINIEQVTKHPSAPSGLEIVSGVYDFSIVGEDHYSFKQAVTIRLRFNPEKVGPGQIPAVYYYDEAEEKWINIGGEISGDFITIQVDHFTKFAVMVATGSVESGLTDIAGHWAEDSIEKLIAMGAVNGYPDGTFKPDHNITRAEFVTILVKVLALEPQNGQIFADTAGHWARDALATAEYYGIVKGYDENTFGPDDFVTREQMAAIVINATDLERVNEETSFEDSHLVSEWAREAVATAVKHGIINGFPDNTLRPLSNATRAEAVTVIVKVLNLLE